MNISVNPSLDLMICGNIFLVWALIFLLLSPVFLIVICFGLQHCLKPRSRSGNPTHSDVFTFNMAAFEMLGLLGYCVNVSRVYISNVDLRNMGDFLSYLTGVGQTLFHVLVCLERYLAVVHPITYLRLKKMGVVIRNVSIAVAWLLSVGVASVYYIDKFILELFSVVIMGVLSLVLITFFCASVLYVLIRPGPGERGGNRKHIDQLKRRAFYTVAAITATLFLKFAPLFVMLMAIMSGRFDEAQLCLFKVCILWFYFPSSFVMPLLFLCRRVKQIKEAQKRNP